MSKPVCLVWVNETKAFEEALAKSGLSDRFETHIYKLGETVPPDVEERTEVLVGFHPGPHLKRMPRLRWVQAITAGVDPWLANGALKDDIALTCARGSHRISMPENILGAMFHLTKPYMQIALDQRESKWTRRQSVPLAGKTLGIL